MQLLGTAGVLLLVSSRRMSKCIAGDSVEHKEPIF